MGPAIATAALWHQHQHDGNGIAVCGVQSPSAMCGGDAGGLSAATTFSYINHDHNNAAAAYKYN